MYKVDINSDLGEGFGAYTIGLDEEIMQYISSANIACGFHAGDPLVMEKTVAIAAEKGIAIGAHPGFPDLQGFGRRNMNCSPEEVHAFIQYQLGALMAIAKAKGVTVNHVKPHGSLYNMAAKDMSIARAIAKAVAEVDEGLILLGLAGSCLLGAGVEFGLTVASEAFADRTYQPDGSLVPRSMAGAVIHDTAEVLSRTLDMIKTGTVRAITGDLIPVAAHSICVHGDNPKAVEFARELRAYLEANQIQISRLSDIVR